MKEDMYEFVEDDSYAEEDDEASCGGCCSHCSGCGE